jgi:intracellular sulfur oxidation DsrE/DsrF family protein
VVGFFISFGAMYSGDCANAQGEKALQIELCGATAVANHWGNAGLLPGVKVNTIAMVRVTELEQEGFTLIYE